MANSSSTSFTDKIADESSALGDRISDGAAQLKAKASELGRRAAEKIDENMTSAADGLDKAASSLHGTAEHLPGVDAVSGFAHSTADRLSATAGYVREHDVDSMMTGVRAIVRKNPGQSLIIAGVVGFLIGRSFKRGSAA
ncbi:hypothetical protein [Paludibaculum fermentans]|uniref:DUF883 domain-containing protein n=1 Tax=Paludibaculum fermentans TaxID=1473598 RepID=A0A7S7SN85_PALFE|nr:hypothetical protein [Paludibaculum fermentans]QOY91194.1 hypothetical protein IRI77_14975 [Paludibaculum fermentans]